VQSRKTARKSQATAKVGFNSRMIQRRVGSDGAAPEESSLEYQTVAKEQSRKI
jgi:hypothetical protein